MNKKFHNAAKAIRQVATYESGTVDRADIVTICDALSWILADISERTDEVDVATTCMSTACMALSPDGSGYRETFPQEKDRLRYVLDRDTDIRR